MCMQWQQQQHRSHHLTSFLAALVPCADAFADAAQHVAPKQLLAPEHLPIIGLLSITATRVGLHVQTSAFVRRGFMWLVRQTRQRLVLRYRYSVILHASLAEHVQPSQY